MDKRKRKVSKRDEYGTMRWARQKGYALSKFLHFDSIAVSNEKNYVLS